MSVGGTVVEVVDVPARGLVWVDTREHQTARQTVAIYVERTPEALSVSEGDSVWWQGPWAFWTPRTGSLKHDPPFVDKKLKRHGYSGVERPKESAK